jgi:hypothetical protein
MKSIRHKSLIAIWFVGLIGVISSLSFAQKSRPDERWVATWATAQQVMRGAPLPQRPENAQGSAPAQQPQPQPATPPPNLAIPKMITNLKNQTIRMIVRVSIGGKRRRISPSRTSASPAISFCAMAQA